MAKIKKTQTLKLVSQIYSQVPKDLICKSEEQPTAPLKLNRIYMGCIHIYMYILDIYRTYMWCFVVLEKQAACLDASYVPNSVACFKKDD